MPTGWGIVVGFVAVLVLFSAAMWAYHTWRAREQERWNRLPAKERQRRLRDPWVPSGRFIRYHQQERRRYELEEPDGEWQEFELRAHMDYDAYRFQYRLPGERP